MNPLYTLASYAIVAIAALSASFLSGLQFPEMNNVWHIPAVLNFAESVEGPHDPYHASFKNYATYFWFGLSSIVNEQNLEIIFVVSQILGNILFATSMFLFVRQVTGQPIASAVSTSALCFCYGMWGLTRLGYSELFVTYATHTQYAIVTCLLSLYCAIKSRFVPSAFVLGLAANINLFMAFWTGLALCLYMILTERKLFTRQQLNSLLVFLLSAIPIIFWVIAVFQREKGSAVDPAFYQTFLTGHMFGFHYPQALVQSFAIFVASIAALRFSLPRDQALEPLGRIALCTTCVLAVATLAPQIAPSPFWTPLVPLRFTSIVMAVCAVIAAALVVRLWSTDQWVWAVMALGGFMLKFPVISVLGFAMLLPSAPRSAQFLRLALPVIAVSAMALPAPSLDSGVKGALVALILFSAISIGLFGSCIQDTTLGGKAWPKHHNKIWTCITAWVISAAALATPPTALDFGSLVAAIVAWLLLQSPGGTSAMWSVKALVLLAIVLVVVAKESEPLKLGILLLALLPFSISIWFGLRSITQRLRRSLTIATSALLIFGLAVGGMVKGAQAGFWAQQSPQLVDFIAVQRWARTNTSREAVFYVVGFEGFSLFSRRKSWWESSHFVAIHWSPSLYPSQIMRRREALDAGTSLEKLTALALRENIDFIVLPRSISIEAPIPEISQAYRNDHFRVFKVSK